MRKRLLLIGSVLLVVATAAGFVYLFAFASRPQSPTFVLYDDKHPNEAVAVYVDPAVLKKYKVSPESFEAAFRAYLDGVGEAIASVVVDMFFPDGPDKKHKRQTMSPEDFESRFGLTVETFDNIFTTIHLEDWTLHPDGTHTVDREYSRKKSTPAKKKR